MNLLKKQIRSASRIISGQKPAEVVNIGRPGDPLSLLVYNGKIYVYNSLGQSLIDGGYISANAILAYSIIAEKLSFSSKKFVHSIVWTATDADTCSWSSGTIKFADGTSISVNAGNTGNIVNRNYIYFDGTATLKKTESFLTAVSGNNLLLAIVDKTTDVDGKCLIIPYLSGGATIDGNTIVTGKVQSTDGKTYFDLNNGLFKINDGTNDRILVGKIGGAYGIKISLTGYDASTDTDLNHFALWVMSDDDEDNVLIKEKSRGSVSVGASSSVNITTGSVLFCLVFVEESAGVYTKAYGQPFDGRGLYYAINSTNLTLYNTTASSKIFKYYIFYDHVV